MSPQSEILGVDQLANYLGVPVHTIHGLTRKRSRARQRNPLPHLKIGKRTYFRRASVESWLLARESEAN